MRKPRYLVLDNKRYLWRDILKLRREQCKAAQQAQPVLFNLQDDERPKSQRRFLARESLTTLPRFVASLSRRAAKRPFPAVGLNVAEGWKAEAPAVPIHSLQL